MRAWTRLRCLRLKRRAGLVAGSAEGRWGSEWKKKQSREVGEVCCYFFVSSKTCFPGWQSQVCSRWKLSKEGRRRKEGRGLACQELCSRVAIEGSLVPIRKRLRYVKRMSFACCWEKRRSL